MSDDRPIFYHTIVNELKHVQSATLDVAVDAILSLLSDKQGFTLDDDTIKACANIVSSLRSAA